MKNKIGFRMFPLAKNHERSQSIGIQSDVTLLVVLNQESKIGFFANCELRIITIKIQSVVTHLLSLLFGFCATILGGEQCVWRCGNLSYSSCAVQSEKVRNKFKLTRYPD